MTPTGPDDREPPVGADVDRAWRALSREEPPASLDASILAAAHREAGAGPQPVRSREAIAERRRWWPLAAAATVAAIAVGVLQLTPPEHLGAPSAETATVSDMPAPTAKKTETVPAAPAGPAGTASAVEADAAPVVKADTTSAAPKVAAAPAPPTTSRGDREAMRQRQEARPAPPPSFASAPEAFPTAPKRVDEGANAANTPPPAQLARKEAPGPLAPPAATGNVAAERAAGAPAAAPDARKSESPAPGAAPFAQMAASRAAGTISDARVKDRAPLPVPDWIALIRRLRDVGETEEAAKELAAFRVAHADHEKLLPPDLRDWHPPEK